MALGLTQSLTEMITGNFFFGGGEGGNGRPTLKADIVTDICEPIF
jgi:hypothetical protein